MGDLARKALEDPQKFAGLSTRFPKPISLLLGQYRCWIAENIIATVTDSSQMKKNNELMKYVKNSDCSTAPGPYSARPLSIAPPKAAPCSTSRAMTGTLNQPMPYSIHPEHYRLRRRRRRLCSIARAMTSTLNQPMPYSIHSARTVGVR